MKTKNNLKGVSLIEVLIAMVILSMGMTGFAKQWNNSLASTIDANERKRIATLSATFNTAITAYSTTIDTTTVPVGTYFDNIENFTAALNREINNHISKRGLYTCTSNVPAMLPPGSGDPTFVEGATLLRPLDQGAAICLSFHSIKRFKDDAESSKVSVGIQMETTASWIDIGGTQNVVQQMTLPLVIIYPITVSPADVPF